MRIARVTGSVTLTIKDQNLPDGKMLICEILDSEALAGLSSGAARQNPIPESVIAYDDLGAGEGCLVALTESAEATAPFRPKKVPLDAYCSAILDKIQLMK
jgi:microcompartment protein CcmK/EutM